MRAERRAIRNEKPLHNIDGSAEGRARWRAARHADANRSITPDRHSNPNVTVRFAEQVKADAEKELGARGWTLADALHAALLWLLADPRRLKQLERYRPAPKVKGRPPKRQG